MTMDCKHCEALLLDHAYGELSPAIATETRTHLAGCAQCSAALARIEGGLSFARRMPLANAPSALSDRLMRAARTQAELNANARAVAIVPPWQAFAEWLRRFAMVRQVQMAIVMMLIVGVGLWSVPELKNHPSPTGDTVVSADHEGEVGPSAALEPAKPLDLAVDPYTGRIRAKGGEREEKLARGSKAADALGEQSRAPAAATAAEGGDLQAPAGPGNADPQTEEFALAEKATRAAEAPKKKAELAKPQDLSDSLDGHAAQGNVVSKDDARFAPPPAPRQDARAKLQAEPASPPAAQASKPSPTYATKAARKPQGVDDEAMNPYRSGGGSSSSLGSLSASSGSGQAQAPKITTSPDALYAQALERYRAADYAGAAPLFESLLARKDASEQRTGALLYQARSLRALGRCDLAVKRYDALVTSYPSSSEAGPALSEGAACYDQLGQPSSASALLQRGVATPSLSKRAKSALSARSQQSAAPPAAAAEPTPVPSSAPARE